MSDKVTLSIDVVDGIAVDSLKWHLQAIEEDLKRFEKEGRGHPDDFAENITLKTYFERILKYYGH